MARDALGSIALVALTVGVTFTGFELAKQGDFGPNVQTWAKNIESSFNGIAGTGTGTGTGTVSASDIATWAKNTGVPTWVGTLFVQDNGSLPQSITALNSWGDSKGYHKGSAWIAPPGVS